MREPIIQCNIEPLGSKQNQVPDTETRKLIEGEKMQIAYFYSAVNPPPHTQHILSSIVNGLK